MTRRFIVRPRAERDIQSAHDWYESQEPGLGERFLEAVQKRLEAIHKMPRACPVECSRWLLAVRPARHKMPRACPVESFTLSVLATSKTKSNVRLYGTSHGITKTPPSV